MVKCAPRTVFCSFLRKYCFFRKNCLAWKYLAFNFCYKKGYIHFWRRAPPSLKKCSCSTKMFFHIFSENVAFSKKLLDKKIFDTSFPIKKVIFIFIASLPLPYKRDLAPRNGYSVIRSFLEKYSFFLFEKTVK